MVVTACVVSRFLVISDHARKSELKTFDDSKAGVKGLVDAGVARLPRIFVHDQIKLDLKLQYSARNSPQYHLPVIDFKGIHDDAARRGEVTDEVMEACEKWGFFQVINHGVPGKAMSGMIDGVRGFHEQDTEVKKQFYTRDFTRRFFYISNVDLYQTPAAKWKDTIYCTIAPHPANPQELPVVCRYVIV